MSRVGQANMMRQIISHRTSPWRRWRGVVFAAALLGILTMQVLFLLW